MHPGRLGIYLGKQTGRDADRHTVKYIMEKSHSVVMIVIVCFTLFSVRFDVSVGVDVQCIVTFLQQFFLNRTLTVTFRVMHVMKCFACNWPLVCKKIEFGIAFGRTLPIYSGPCCSNTELGRCDRGRCLKSCQEY